MYCNRINFGIDGAYRINYCGMVLGTRYPLSLHFFGLMFLLNLHNLYPCMYCISFIPTIYCTYAIKLSHQRWYIWCGVNLFKSSIHLVQTKARLVTTRSQPCRYCPLWAQGDNIYMVGCGSLQMVSEPIPDPGVGICLAP